jgi:hypothetical protein
MSTAPVFCGAYRSALLAFTITGKYGLGGVAGVTVGATLGAAEALAATGSGAAGAGAGDAGGGGAALHAARIVRIAAEAWARIGPL